MGTSYALADFVTYNNQTGFNSLNTSDATGLDVFAVTNLNSQSLSSLVVGSQTTGNNTADNNTTDAFVGSGSILIGGLIVSDVNSNVVSDMGGWWFGLFSAGNDVTGANSINDATTTADSVTAASDVNDLFLAYDVSVDGSTGNNTADNNTGSAGVETGGIAGILSASDNANSNELFLGGDMANQSFLSQAVNSTTGAGSVNDSETTIANTIAVDNLNTSNVTNAMFLSADTGGNSASSNTGDPSVVTGSAAGAIVLGNQLNSNVTEINVPAGSGSVEASNDTTGSGSSNTATAALVNTTAVLNTNTAGVANSANVDLNTGNNTADNNTLGGFIETGNATGAVAISNELNSNFTQVNSGLADATVLAGNMTTGAGSVNDASATLDNVVVVDNSNSAGVSNSVAVTSDTGNNTADNNTAMGGSVETGNASGTVAIVNDVNSNDTVVNSSPIVSVSVDNDVTGANSINNSSVSAVNVVDVTNTNTAEITNDVTITSNTGGNSASNNTEGGSVVTGSADMTFVISNSGNSNSTEVGQ